MLSFLPFSSLYQSPGSPFLAEQFDLFQVASGRDLLDEFQPSEPKTIALFGNPKYRKIQDPPLPKEDLALASLPPESEKLRDLSFGPLPYTQVEVGILSKLVEGNYQATAFLGASATEQSLREIENPTILHLATHGFFIDSSKKISGNSGQARFFGMTGKKDGIPDNPMRRAGLALAGAQITFEAWGDENRTTVAENDGILTAEEAALLNLKGTWLTTLSACDTGSGRTQAGEGVLGLRRAFAQAGTQNLLLTLWPVNDKHTVDFMKAFYTEALKTGDAPRALAKTQRDMLRQMRKRRAVAPAVKHFAPFVLTFRGGLN